ncbi:MAG: UDP-N-acetylmuramate dehydrogenase [Lachnospiraceae bacterium]|nr:UDP-N-acetylmuramate dehydrogenase [Lachnospiraceae bacterium]
MKNHIDTIKKILPEDRIFINESMKKHTTFRTGGAADLFLMPENAEQLSELIRLCRREGREYFIIGNGSNLLVSDRGYRGIIIAVTEAFSDIEVSGNEIHAGAGALLSGIADTARKNSLSGFEFASGIPGTAGGAMVMNAGAYGGEMKDVVKSVEALTPEGERVNLSNSEMGFGYRKSIVKSEGLTVLKIIFSLNPGNEGEIKAKMDELSAKRREKQPLEFPSAGSTFKRPEGHFAGKLIMDAGLAGFSVGGASVSEKHCGFIINRGNATSDDVYRLIKKVREVVKEGSGVLLESEVMMIGDF